MGGDAEPDYGWSFRFGFGFGYGGVGVLAVSSYRGGHSGACPRRFGLMVRVEKW